MAQGKGKANRKGPVIDENGILIVPPPKSVGNKEHFQRLNYILQIAEFMLQKADDPEQSLSRNYMKNMDLIQKKTKVSVSPNVKRQICKKCQRLMVVGQTMEMFIENKSRKGRHIGSKNDVLVYRCKCGSIKRFPVGKDPSYKLHVENPQNTVDIDN